MVGHTTPVCFKSLNVALLLLLCCDVIIVFVTLISEWEGTVSGAMTWLSYY